MEKTILGLLLACLVLLLLSLYYGHKSDRLEGELELYKATVKKYCINHKSIK
jgi:predicted outer membrane lipoprotein